MKFLHLADLHIGKHLNKIPLFEDQKYVLQQALDLAQEENVDAVVVAGDVYDSSYPTNEATEFYDWFLTALHRLQKPILMISGNHDSEERLGIANQILTNDNIYIVTNVEKSLTPITIGDTNFYLLPYFRPSDINHAFGSETKSFSEAFALAVEKMNVDTSKQNVLVTHQALLPKQGKLISSGSETSLDIEDDKSVAGSETIDVSLAEDFDYVALGHIHKCQNIAKNARYCGALLHYYTDEVSLDRTFTIVTLENKDLTITDYPVKPLRAFVVLTGTMEELLAREGNEDDYVFIRLNEESYVDNPKAKLEAKYNHIVGLNYIGITAKQVETPEFENVEQVDKEDLFASFFLKYGGRELDEDEKEFIHSVFEEEEA